MDPFGIFGSFGGFGCFGGLFDDFLNPFQNVPDYSSYNADKKAYDAVKDYVEKNKYTIENYKNQISDTLMINKYKNYTVMMEISLIAFVMRELNI